MERTKAINVSSVNEQRHQAGAERNSREPEPGVTSEYTVPWRLAIRHPCPDFKYCLAVCGPDACKVSSVLQPRGPEAQGHKETTSKGGEFTMKRLGDAAPAFLGAPGEAR